MKLIKNKKTEKENKSPLDYYFGKPRIEMAGSECLVDGLEKIQKSPCRSEVRKSLFGATT